MVQGVDAILAYFSTPTPSFASEQLNAKLTALSTIPVQLPQSLSGDAKATKPSSYLENALHELSSSRPPLREKVVEILKTLVNPPKAESYVVSEMDQVVETEVIGRAVTIMWKEILDELLRSAVKLDEERRWWESTLNSRTGVGIYLLQTLPHRIVAALPPNPHLSLHTFTQLPRSALFPKTPASALSAITSPYTLTRREMLGSREALRIARDSTAEKIGILALEGPDWEVQSLDGNISSESNRIYKLLCEMLEVPAVPDPSTPSKKRSASSIPPAPSGPTPANLLSLFAVSLPRFMGKYEATLKTHKRPTGLTRLWFPLLFLPPALYTASSLVVRNKEWLRDQVKNAKETVKGFFISWVWEPIEDIGKTLRGGGEGLGVAPTTVKSDQASLERMVLDLGKDYYHLSGPELDALGAKVRAGDMEEVLRVYEKELQSPVKNALLGSLIRTLLIQVQKTKTDLSLSLLSLDHLLRSQQLTFAFVGVAPSVLILYGLGGWFKGVWKGEKRGKSRRRNYFNGLRDIERLLITAPKKDVQMSEKDRGLLIVGVSGMRNWASGLSGNSKESFLDDLRLVEDPELSRGDKLRVIERIWRGWGTEGKRKY